MDTTYTMENGAVLAFSKGLFEPKPYKDPKTGREQGEPIYSCMLAFDLDNPEWKALRLHALKVAQTEWNGIKWADIRTPFKSGTALADARIAENEKRVAGGLKPKPSLEFARDKGTLHMRSKWPPTLSAVQTNGKILDYTDATRASAEPKFFFGAEVVCVLNFAPNEVRGKAVSCYVNTVMATGKGTRLGGAKPGSEAFAGYAGRASDENPLDDEIPF